MEYTDFVKDIEALPSISGEEIFCPKCGERMDWDDSCPDEQYMMDGTFESQELYTCFECGTNIYVTQVYEPTTRYVQIEED